MYEFKSKRPCVICGMTEVHVRSEVAVDDNNEIIWLETYHCHHCNDVIEISYRGHIHRYKNHDIHINGRWALQLESLGVNKRQALKAIKDILKLSYGDIAIIRKTMPSVAITGTKGEMEIYKELIQSVCEDVDLSIHRVHDSTTD